jgi:hypothetical protein
MARVPLPVPTSCTGLASVLGISSPALIDISYQTSLILVEPAFSVQAVLFANSFPVHMPASTLILGGLSRGFSVEIACTEAVLGADTGPVASGRELVVEREVEEGSEFALPVLGMGRVIRLCFGVGGGWSFLVVDYAVGSLVVVSGAEGSFLLVRSAGRIFLVAELRSHLERPILMDRSLIPR